MPNEQYLTQYVRDLTQHINQISRSGLSKMHPLVITCVLNGRGDTKENHSNVPQSVEELSEQGYRAYLAGASILQAASNLPVEEEKRLYVMLRDRCPDVIISSHAGGRRRIKKVGEENYTTSMPQLEALASVPEMASVEITCNVSECDGSIGFMAHSDLEQIVRSMHQAGIKPQFEMTKTIDTKYLNYLEKKGLLDTPYWSEMHFGGTGIPPILEEMMTIVQNLPDNGLFSVVGDGAAQTAILAQAVIMGLHVRVGMGDNIYYAPGQLAEDNAQLVARIARLATELNRPIATPEQAREMMGLGLPRAY